MNIEFNAAQTTAIRAIMLGFQHLGITPIDFGIGAEGRLGPGRLITMVTMGARIPGPNGTPVRIRGRCYLDRTAATDPWDVTTLHIEIGTGVTFDRPLSSLAAGH